MENRLTILIVDDDEVDRMIVHRHLKGTEVKVQFFDACNGVEAIALLKQQSFDCIFLDYRLPDKDGLELLQQLRQQGIKTPIVVLTGQGDERLAVELMKAGASDYLSKSNLSPELLTQVLRNAVRVFHAEQQVAFAHQQLQESHAMLLRQNLMLEHQQRQIQLQNLQLSEASRLKSRFLAATSHELRTPMNSIIGFSQVLLRRSKGLLNDQQTMMLERILENARHLLTLIEEILDFSKVGTDPVQMKLEAFNLVVWTTAIAEKMRLLAERKGLTLTVNSRLKNPQVVNDRQRVQQILLNLLSNAIKFTDTGEVRIELDEISADWIAIAISDSGIGIASTDLERIFEPFHQIDQTTTRRQGGTGLGLALTHALVQLMSGRITVESEVGKGSVFRVELPRKISAGETSGDRGSSVYAEKFNQVQCENPLEEFQRRSFDPFLNPLITSQNTSPLEFTSNAAPIQVSKEEELDSKKRMKDRDGFRKSRFNAQPSAIRDSFL